MAVAPSNVPSRKIYYVLHKLLRQESSKKHYINSNNNKQKSFKLLDKQYMLCIYNFTSKIYLSILPRAAWYSR